MTQENENKDQNQNPEQAAQAATSIPQGTPEQYAGNAPTTQFEGLGNLSQTTSAATTPPTGSGSVEPINALVPATTWKDKYEKEHKRSQILAVVAAIACVLTLGAGVWAISKSNRPARPDFAGGQFDGRGGPGGRGGMGGPGSQNGRGENSRLLRNLFNADGSVNTEKLQQFKANAPQDWDPNALVDRAVTSGAITEEQGKKLKAALNASSTSTPNANSNSTSGTNSSFHRGVTNYRTTSQSDSVSLQT